METIPHPQKPNIPIILLLTLITLCSFYSRRQDFTKPGRATIDENIYFSLGRQFKNDPSHYTAIPYAELMHAEERNVPAYLQRPLYKHPPLFPMLIALSMDIFGESWDAAGYISLACGILMIPLVYFLGAFVFNQKTGLLAAILFSMDPISIICSQKVWMDPTIALFSLLSAVFFVRGLKQGKNHSFILAGISSGLAANTKYTGILVTLAAFLFACFHRRDLFKNRSFLTGLALPFVLLIPWFFWNYNVYGTKLFEALVGPHVPTPHFISQQLHLLIVLLLGALAVILLFRRYKNSLGKFLHAVKEPLWWVTGIGGLSVLAYYRRPIMSIVSFSHLPSTSWSPIFYDESYTFYLKRLLEFSLLYIFAFLSFLVPPEKQRDDAVTFLRWAALVLLAFFVLWKSYQSRYILSCLPFLILLAADLMIRLYHKICDMESFLPRISLQGLFLSFCAYSVVKTLFINAHISFPNFLCYF